MTRSFSLTVRRARPFAGFGNARLAPLALSSLVALAACSGDASGILSPSADPAGARGRKPADTTATPIVTTPGNSLAGALLWVDPNSNAKKTADSWRLTRPADATQMDKVAAGATARWIGNWNTNVQADVDAATSAITSAGALPLFVAYNIPQRDCGGLSGSSTTTADAYRSWVTAFANGIGARKAAVVLEPDALAAMDCLNTTDQQLRLDLLKYAVQAFAAKGSITVYLDAGHPGWRSATTMASRLVSAGIAMAQGFSLNVSNVLLTSDNVTYGSQISSLVSGKHFIVDTGRNGLGPTADAQWCNPAGRALGARPTTATGNALVDAFLWIKTPGESDGACNGAPAAGSWMPEYALGLAQRAAF